MAIYGNLKIIKEQVPQEKFKLAFEYLEKIMIVNSRENKRLLSLPMQAFEKVMLDESTFALEQVYNSKDRSECFFESHRKYIDVQFILEGEEIIEIDNVENLTDSFSYDESIDLIKYDDSTNSSLLKLKKGDIAIFYPEDAHMPCIKLGDTQKIVKTVVKVQV